MSVVIPTLQPHMLARWQEVAHIMRITGSYGRDLPVDRPSYPLPEGRLLMAFYGGIATIPELSALRQSITLDMSTWRERVLADHTPVNASHRQANTAALLAQLSKGNLP